MSLYKNTELNNVEFLLKEFQFLKSLMCIKQRKEPSFADTFILAIILIVIIIIIIIIIIIFQLM